MQSLPAGPDAALQAEGSARIAEFGAHHESQMTVTQQGWLLGRLQIVSAEAKVLAGGVAGVGHEEGVHPGLAQVGAGEPEEVHGAVDGWVE
jgi:hypothetical protein